MPNSNDSTKPRLCSITGCNSPHKARSYCSKHYSHLLKCGDLLVLSNREYGPRCEVRSCRKAASKNHTLCEIHQRISKERAIRLIETCTVEGCEKTPTCLGGFCRNHKERKQKYGSPTAKTPARRSRLSEEIDRIVAIKNHGDECIRWPFTLGNHGYGLAKYKGKRGHAHAHVLREFSGPEPQKGAHAAHECGNRWCVNPLHLSWKTPLENNKDKLKHGTWQRGEMAATNILTENQVIEILHRHKQGERTMLIAEDYPVEICTIQSIIGRRSWKHVKI